jgi:cyclopropane-fatty-acyl-phospholipid synthase
MSNDYPQALAGESLDNVSRAAGAATAGRWFSKTAPPSARVVLAMLASIEHGVLEIHLPGGERLSFGHTGPSAQIRLANWKPFSVALRRGDIGFAESFIAGDWSTDSLAGVLEIAVANRDRLEAAIYGRRWTQLIARLRHLLNRNDRAGSRRNIQAHYDLGNPFYRLWLDPSMSYSSALFAGRPDLTLEQAQHAKYQRVIDELALPAGSQVLEIGCGWGGFAEQAARQDLRVRGLTLSHEQLAYATDRLRGAGLEHVVEIELRDYRDETRLHDGIASIEMFEAVGERYWPAYFDTIRRTLAPGGRAVVQTITIADELFARYRRGTDFIQQYVFPGGMLPSDAAFRTQAEMAGLRVAVRFAFGQDYAKTLALWRNAFIANLDAVRAQGFDTRFERTWEFYLAYCEAAFRHRSTDVVQYTLEHAPRR